MPAHLATEPTHPNQRRIDAHPSTRTPLMRQCRRRPTEPMEFGRINAIHGRPATASRLDLDHDQRSPSGGKRNQIQFVVANA